MRSINFIFVSLLLIPTSFSMANTETVDTLIQVYQSQGATTMNAKQGKLLWEKNYQLNGKFAERSCTSCHTKDLAAPGKHVKTSKTIEPMAPLVNPDRLTDIKKVEKWFKRNCKWTLGRACTAEEKGSLLLYINSSVNF